MKSWIRLSCVSVTAAWLVKVRRLFEHGSVTVPFRLSSCRNHESVWVAFRSLLRGWWKLDDFFEYDSATLPFRVSSWWNIEAVWVAFRSLLRGWSILPTYNENGSVTLPFRVSSWWNHEAVWVAFRSLLRGWSILATYNENGSVTLPFRVSSWSKYRAVREMPRFPKTYVCVSPGSRLRYCSSRNHVCISFPFRVSDLSSVKSVKLT
jgi:hypothetical protein